MSYEDNPLLDTDSYKVSHWLQYPEETTSMYSYLESRGGKFYKTVFFGLQYYIKKYLSKPFTLENILEAEKELKLHGEPFNADGFKYIVEKHGGYWPIKIKAVPEGMLVPAKNILTSVESTDPNCFWVVSYLETLLMRLWYPITVATLSWEAKQAILESLRMTAENPNQEVLFKLHDFGSRGVSSKESAAIGGAAHLVNFLGTDTIVGMMLANEHYYGHECPGGTAGFSIPAAEHSTMTILGREGELGQFQRMLKHFAKPGGLVAVVSDSYDIWNAIDNYWGDKLKQQVIDSGATVVIRPDSGDPVKVVLEVLQRLEAKFGSTLNKKGYKVLNYVRVIQGDGVNLESIKEILKVINEHAFSTSNVAFGMGGGLLQKVDRDTNKFAYKCSHAVVAGVERNVFKEPVTDPGKRSKAGRLCLVNTPTGCQTVSYSEQVAGQDLLQTVFENGKLLIDQKLTDIRSRSNA